MSKRFLIGLLAIAVVAAVGGASLAIAKPTKKKVTITAQLGLVSNTNGVLTDAGTVSGAFGPGAVVLRSSFSGTTIKGKGTVWYTKGTFRLSATLQVSPQPDGSIQYSGNGKLTGGTGKFRHARGTFTVTGDSPPNDGTPPQHATLTSKGTITFGR